MADARHASVVSEWMERVVAHREARDIVPLFGRALLAVWDRAHVTLGEVTLQAVAQRVLHGARARFGVLRPLGLEPTRASFRAVAEREDAVGDRAELVAAVHFVLVELLALIGTLTAEILTAALHDALRAVELPAAAPARSTTPNRGGSR